MIHLCFRRFYYESLRAVSSIFSDLVDIMVTEHGVKQRVEVIEKIDHFDGVTERGDGGETHNVTKVDRHLIEVLRFYCATGLQGLSDRTGKENGEEKL